jgi:hypothetical protein
MPVPVPVSPEIKPGYIVFPSHKNKVRIDFIWHTAADEKKRNF